MKAESCRSCRFYKSYGDFGECRRFPPIVLSASTTRMRPQVDPGDWCGEWQLGDTSP